MTPNQERFVEEYIIDLNATQAAIRAGYSEKGANVQASRLLADPSIKAKIEQAIKERSERTDITQDRVLHELALLAFSDVTHYTVDEQGNVALAEHAPKTAMRALQSIKRKVTTRTVNDVPETTVDVELKLWDKPGPLKLAGRHVGLFPDKIEVTGNNGGPVDVQVTKIERVIVDGSKD